MFFGLTELFEIVMVVGGVVVPGAGVGVGDVLLGLGLVIVIVDLLVCTADRFVAMGTDRWRGMIVGPMPAGGIPYLIILVVGPDALVPGILGAFQFVVARFT